MFDLVWFLCGIQTQPYHSFIGLIRFSYQFNLIRFSHRFNLIRFGQSAWFGFEYPNSTYILGFWEFWHGELWLRTQISSAVKNTHWFCPKKIKKPSLFKHTCEWRCHRFSPALSFIHSFCCVHFSSLRIAYNQFQFVFGPLKICRHLKVFFLFARLLCLCDRFAFAYFNEDMAFFFLWCHRTSGVLLWRWEEQVFPH